MGVIAVGRDRRLDGPGAAGVRAREKKIGGTGGSLEPPGPLLTRLHTVYMAYSERLPTRLNPLAERTCFSQVTAMLRLRPLAMTFAYTTEDVDMAAAKQTALVLEYPCDVTFHTPVGEPLGIIFGEYPSRHMAHCAPPARPPCLPCMPSPARLPACPARAAWRKAATFCLYWVGVWCQLGERLLPQTTTLSSRT